MGSVENIEELAQEFGFKVGAVLSLLHSWAFRWVEGNLL